MCARIIRNTKIIDGYFLLTVRLPESFQTPMPGQFIMVREKGHFDPLLGRPFSVYHFERTDGAVIIEILYKVVGKGTKLLSMLRKGVLLEIYGPFGNAFNVNTDFKKVILICGGIGIAPLTYLATHYRKHGDTEIICYLGAADAEKLVGIAKIQTLSPNIHISTDDGSMGYCGAVTEIFSRDIASYDSRDAMIYACGPRPMLKRLAEMLSIHSVTCEVLLEERMACGIGACLGCAMETQSRGGGRTYLRVCKDGPVFDIRNIIWS